MSFKICAIGCGNWSCSKHGPSYAKYAATHDDTELTACCDIDEEKAIRYRDKFGFARHYTDFAQMLNTERPDAVCLMMRGKLTCELSCAILEMGYPLITEKPPGETTEEIDRMIAAADATGAPSQVAFNRRYMPLMRELKRLLSERFDPSEIQHIRYDLIRVDRKDADFSTTAIHAIDAARFIAGSDYAQVTLRYREFPEHGANVANVFMDCAFESGATAHVNICPITGVVVERGTVYAYDNTFALRVPVEPEGVDFPGSVQHFEKGRLKWQVTGPEVSGGGETYECNGVYAENVSFFDDIRNGRRPAGDLKSARQSVELAEHMRERRAEYER